MDGGSALCNVGTSGGSGPIQLKDFRTRVLEIVVVRKMKLIQYIY
ncbi:hypothetical protein ANAPC2_00860 [Anaplasma phagocytophilum]|nr:hypothetical protein ANAPC2_00860 [Anaplasma phagocytophilum]